MSQECGSCSRQFAAQFTTCPFCRLAVIASDDVFAPVVGLSGSGRPQPEPIQPKPGPFDWFRSLIAQWLAHRSPAEGELPWRGGQVVFGILLVLLAAFFVSILVVPVGKLTGDYEVAASIWISSHLVGLVMLGVVWLLALRPHRSPLSMLGLKPLTMPQPSAIFTTVGVLGVSLGATALYGILAELPGFDILRPPDSPTDIAFPGWPAAFTFEALALWTPLTEEVFFRGFIFAGLVPRLGSGRAIVASALIFSLFHIFRGGVGILVPIFIMGLLLAWLYHRTSSLWASIAAHTGQNAVAVGSTLYGVQAGGWFFF